MTLSLQDFINWLAASWTEVHSPHEVNWNSFLSLHLTTKVLFPATVTDPSCSQGRVAGGIAAPGSHRTPQC